MLTQACTQVFVIHSYQLHKRDSVEFNCIETFEIVVENKNVRLGFEIIAILTFLTLNIFQ